MKFKSSDLPDDAKSRLLDHIRDRIGSDQYYRIVDNVGEDKLIDLILNRDDGVPSYQANPWFKALRALGFYLCLCPILAYFLYWDSNKKFITWWRLLLGSIAGAVVMGPAVFFISLPIIYILALIFYGLYNLIGRTGMVRLGKVTGIVAAVGVIGCLFLAVGPWLFGGVRLWWGWILGHF